MKNFLSKLWSLSRTDRVRTLAIDAVSLSSFCRVNMLKLVSVLVILLTLGVGNAWGADLTTADLNFGTAAVTETFESVNTVSTSGKSGSTTTVTNYTTYGIFTHGYIGRSTSDKYSIKSAATPMTSKYLEISTTTKGAGMSFSRTFATKGAFSFKIAKTSATYIGLYGAVANSTIYAKANSSVYLYFTGSKIQINNGSGWINAVTSLPSTTTLDITVVYNNTTAAATYGNNVSLGAKTAHIFVNGTAVMDGSSPKAFTIPGAALTAFRIMYNNSGTSKVDDIKIYDALPTSAGTSVTLSKAATSNGSFTLSNDGPLNTATAQTITVTGTPNTGYYLSGVTQSGASSTPTITKTSATTYTIQYPASCTGTSTITATFSPIWYLKGDFNSWDTSDPLTNITSNVATVTKSLSKTTGYEFKVYNAQEDAWYGNNGKIIDDVSGWTFSTSEGNCKVFATVADDYTFKFNISTKAMQVQYPSMTHPNDAYVYLTNWWDCYVHYWYTDGGGDHALIDWGYDTQLSRHEEICETDYWCVPILDGYPKLIMKDNAGDPSNTTGDQTTASNAGKYITHNGVSWGWHDFDRYDINFGGNGNTGGSMSSITDLCPGAEQALTPNAFTKTHYSFSCWHADVAVKVGESTISAGGDISNGATIKDIQSDINLTAQWSPVSYTITKTFTNVANAGLPASFTYTGAATTALNSSFTVDATNFFLPSSITVTMGGETLTEGSGKDYTYNSSSGAFTFDVAITGNIVITATAVPKLKSIAITTQPTTRAYLVGDVFSSTGAVVTATMGDGSTKAVTASATWTPAGALSAGTGQTVTATYTEAGIEKTATTTIDVYSVTVNKVNMSGTAIADAGVTASCSGRTLSQSVSTTNYKFNSWVVTAGGVTVSTNTITGTPTGNVTINAKFHDPITVTWKVGSGAASGSPTTEVKYNTAITALPSTPADNALASCGTNKFMGWTAAGELKGTGHSAPADLFTTVGGATALTENTTYRAVFASSTSGAAANTVLFSENWTDVTDNTIPSSPSASGSTVYGGATITYTWTDGTTTTQTYASGGPNSNENILISKSNGAWKASGIKTGNATKIVFTYAKSGSGTVSVSSPTSNVSVGGSSSGSYITFTGEVSTFDLEFKNTNGSNNLRLDDIEVKVYTAGTTAVDYQTGCCEAPGTALSITSANSVATGGTVSLTSTGGNGGTVTWSVVNGTGTATVAGTTLTAGSIGTVTVKAHQDANTVLGTEYCAQDAEQAFTVVSSTINVTGVEVSPTTKAIVPGETFDITPTISPSNATDKSVSWTSNASDKASVSSGTVTGVAAGTATITCTTTDGSYTATTAVTVYGVTMQALDEDGNAIAVGGPGTPSRTGASISPAADAGNYVFKEWAISGASLGSSASTKANTITNPTGAVTVTAKYYKPRTVKWSVNGNDSYNTGGPTTTVAYNGTISTIPTNPSGLACAGTFIAWTDAAHNNGTTAKPNTSYYGAALYTDAGDFPNITAATTTFYAVFAEQSSSDGYKYIGDDGTLTDGKKYIFVSSKSAGSAYALKATDLAAPNSGNNGTAVSVTVTSNAEGVLVTTVNTVVEFEYVSSGTKLKYEVDGPATRYLFINGDGVGMKADDNRSRYTTDAGLQGWNNKVTTYYDVYYNSTSGKFEKKESADSRVYAFIKQTPTYSNYVTECDANIVSVTYDANGGSTSCTNTTTDKTEDFTVCSSAPTRDYYTFAGWLCSADDEVYQANATIDADAIDADFTLTAQWTPVPYSITYNYNGGSAQVDPVPATSYTIESSDITLQTPTKGHDRFDGWYENADLSTGGVKTTIAAGSHENKTYYAKWTARHEIIFDADGATTTIYRADDEDLSASVADQGSVPSDPSAPTACSSKVFVGWSESTIDGETDDEPADLMKPAAGTVDEDKHYYAVWANESSESGTVKLIDDAFNVTGTDAVTSRSGWTSLSTIYGGSGSIRFSSGSNPGSMKLVKTGMGFGTNVTSATITFKIKKYSGSETSGTLTIGSDWVNDNTTKFSKDGGVNKASSVTYTTSDASNWTSCTCNVYDINSNTEIILDGTTNQRIHVKDFLMTYTGTIYSYSAYSTSCCATNVTLSQNSPEHGTIAFGKTKVPTCGDKEVSLTITPAAGYQLSSYEVATGSGKVAAKSVSPAISLDNNSSAVQNITLTFAEDANGAYDVTAAFSLMTVTSWAWTLNSAAIPDPLNLYVGQSARLDVAYTPAGVDASKKTYTRNKDNAYINWVGSAYAGYSTISGKASTGENTTAVTFTHADGPSTTVNVKVLPLPLTHFEDLVHGKAFANVAATIEDNALSATKTTPTSDDWTTPNANPCEENHLHLVGWIREDWPALVNYLNGTGAAPTTVAITGAGNDGEGHAYYIAAGASINVQIFDGVTFYAVWSKVE